MNRQTILVLTVAMVLVAGCTGASGGQGTTTETVTKTATIPNTASTATATATTGRKATMTETSTSVRTTANEASSTLFAGGNPHSEASRGPRTFVEGKPITVDLEISNGEERRMNYTTVIRLARVNTTGPNATITDRWVLDRSATAVRAGERQTITRNVTANTTGRNLLLEFLLYRSDPPATPTYENSYRNFSIPINVTSSPTRENKVVAQSSSR